MTTVYKAYADLAKVDRSLKLPPVDRDETTVEHSFHLALTVMAVSDWFGVEEASQLKMLKLALIHDLHEGLAGDLCAISDISDEVRQQQQLKEEEAVVALGRSFKLNWPELTELLEEYEAKKTFEARFVNALDKTVPFMLEFEQGFEATRSKQVGFRALAARQLKATEGCDSVLRSLLIECLERSKPYLEE